MFFGEEIGPVTEQQRKRGLITLIFAGRNRIIVIRRELSRTKNAGPDAILPHKGSGTTRSRCRVRTATTCSAVPKSTNSSHVSTA